MAASPNCLGDPALRDALLQRLFSRCGSEPDTLIIEELGLRHGKCRVDVAVINGRIEGYEIKSQKDSLSRLHRQVEVYSLVLDRATLLCDEVHIDEALPLTPDWWGVVLAKVGPRGGISLRTIRRPSQNPAVDAASVVKLLWRDEAFSILEELGESKGLRSATRRRLYGRLVDVLDPEEIKARVRGSLKARKAWRAAGLYRPCDDSDQL